MSNLDNHMDELFQKAAENYPLKTAPGNFDDLMPFIAGKTVAITNPIIKGKPKTALLLIVFLITGGTISTYLINNYSSNKTTNDKVPVQEILNSLPQNKTVQQINIDAPLSDNSDAETENILKVSENIFKKNKLNSFNKGKTFTKITHALAVTDDVTVTENNKPDNNEEVINKTLPVTTNLQQINNDNLNHEVKKEIITQPEQKKELAKEEAKSTDKNKKNKPSFYYGFTAGAELNQVKTQAMTKAGVNGGIILGLQINKKLSVETGVQLSQKKYYSEGKYFKPKTGTMPANMIVTSLEGTSTLIEIPVSVKYNFSKKQNTFYGKAGVSSYIITKESNKYQAVVSGQQQEVNSTYKNPHSYLASEVRISAGYQHTLTKKLNTRVEPYIQIPLKGIGIGALPVTSTGLQLVLSRN